MSQDPAGEAERPGAQEMPRPRRWGALGRRLAWGAAGLCLLLAGGIVAVWVLAGRTEWGPMAAARASAALGRPVAIGSLRVAPGRWVAVELRDARIDNMAGGTRPAMVEVAGVTAEIDALSLLHGPLVVRRLAIEGLDVLLERTEGGTANWHFGLARPTATRPAPAQPDRSVYPTLLQARVVGTIVFRTRGGQALRTELDGVQVMAEGADLPLKITGPGSYNGVPVAIQAELGSMALLRDSSTPYPADLRFTSDDTVLRFQGTMTDPLSLDGARGSLSLTAPKLDALYRVAGVSGTPDPAISLSGAFRHEGPQWELTDATGFLGSAGITGGSLRLQEGGPDAVAVALDFAELDLNAVLGEGPREQRSADLALSVDRAPDTLIEVALTAKQLIYGSFHLSDVLLRAAQTPGRVAVDVLSLTYLGAKIQASGQVEAAEQRGAEGGRISATIEVAGMEAQALRQALDIGQLPVTGPVDGHVAVAAEGATLNRAAREARVSALIGMIRGSIAREVVEMASTDARLLFRRARGMTGIACMVAVLDVRGGAGTVSPLRVRSADGTIVGRGTFDLYRRRIDLTIASESRTTSAFALDVPVRVSGSLANPSIGAARLSAAGRAQLAAGDQPGRLLPALQPFARRSACLAR